MGPKRSTIDDSLTKNVGSKDGLGGEELSKYRPNLNRTGITQERPIPQRFVVRIY
ncbi:hypothetical protein RESH_03184 [Rhodopirellula europaea SH398]|uniref:Uncharacterized protein n=1 Tax=Rhodopirellula europaea SH398 TaxID=1263868 RepID=M5SJ65_9BACT|nr:hypothetical protein RESH_03184 [Rhodopirellula europaea SH398]